MGIRNLQFVLSGNDKSASKALDKVGGKADGLARKFAGVGSALAGGAAVAGLVSFGRSSVDAFKESEKSAAELAFAFEKFPKLADSNVAAFKELNSQLAKKTRFDDDATASGQAVLAQFGLTGKQILKVTPLLQDYAARTGKDLPEAAADLGKAFDGNARALKPLGIQYKSTGDKAKDFENVQKLLNDKVGGFAEKEGATAAGKAEILANKFGELKETVGQQLMPVITTFVDYLSDKVVPAAQKLADEFAAGKGTGGELKETLAGLRDVAAELWPHVKTVAEKTAQFVGFLADHPDVVKTAAAGVALYWGAMKLAAIWTGAMAAINLVALATGISGVGAASATAATDIDRVGSAAGGANGKLSRFLKLLGPLGIGAAVGTGVAAAVAAAEGSKSNQASTLAGLPTATIKPKGKPSPTITFNGETFPRGGAPTTKGVPLGTRPPASGRLELTGTTVVKVGAKAIAEASTNYNVKRGVRGYVAASGGY